MNFQHRLASVQREYWFLVLQAVALFVLFAYSSPRRLKDVPTFDEAKTFAFTKDETTSATLALMHGGWQTTDKGATPEDTDAAIEMPLPEGPWLNLHVTLIGSENIEWIATAQRGFERTTRLKVFAGNDVVFEGQQLPGKDSEAPLMLRISPKGTSPGTLERVHVRLSAFAQPPVLPPVPAIFFVSLFPVSIFIFLQLGAARDAAAAMKVSAVISLLAVAAFYYRPDILRGLWMATAGLFLVGAAAPFIRVLRGSDDNLLSSATVRRLAEVSAVFAILGFGLWTRWSALLTERLLPLRYDASGYFAIAMQGTFYKSALDVAPWVREPLFPALLRCWFAIFTASETSARAAGVPIGALVPVAAYLAGRRIFSPLAAFAAGGLLAVNSFSTTLSASVLRDDLLSLLFLTLVCIAIYTRQFPLWRAALIGIVAAALALTRVSNLFLLIPLIAWIGWQQRWRISEIILCGVLFVTPVIPHLLFNAKIGAGDFLYSANVHTPYYLNRLHVGEPGYPATIAEWAANPYRPIAAPDHLLTSGGIVAGAKRIAVGYFKIFVWNFPHGQLFHGNELVMAFGLIGAWVFWRRRGSWWVAAAYVIFMFPIAVIATIVFDERLASPAAAMIALVWGGGVEFAIANAWIALNSRKPKASQLRPALPR
ncbi:MAG: glycosyltransferase family 39 protein [Candidatus Sumerlaeota bacterium]